MFSLFKDNRSAKQEIRLHYGGYYAYPSEETGMYGLIRLLAIDPYTPTAVHYSMFNEKFDHLPKGEEIEKLKPFVGHVPQDASVIAKWGDHVEVLHKPLTKQDLEGYAIFQKQSRGYDDETSKKDIDAIIEHSKQMKTVTYSSPH